MIYGGRIQWSATAICETYKISCLTGQHFTKGDSANHSFKGPAIPLGAMVEYHPTSAKDLSRLHQFGTKVLQVFSSVMYFSREGIWKGDIMVADIEELEKMDASGIRAWRLNAKEVLTPKNGEKIMFLIPDGKRKTIWRRTSTLIRDSPERGEEQGNLPGESDGSPATPLRHSSPGDGEARKDFWSISGNFIYLHHR